MRDYGERVPWGDAPTRFDGLRARAALSNVNLAECFAGNHAHAASHATVWFLPTGGVFRVTVVAPLLGIETRDCLAETLGTARIAPFAGAPRAVAITVD